jgi:triacylglycerol esterase/lipase EstA (alpha/beta hydrolase family)
MRRILSVLASMALAGSLTLVAQAPAHAAPARANGQANPVVFIHGWSPDGNANCAAYWSAVTSSFASAGWTGELATFGYYSGNTNCTINYPGDTDHTSIKTVGRALANEIYNRYSVRGVKIDVVAHSMGGLVIRSALTEMAKGAAGYPPYVYVEDVVTLGSPHNGAIFAGWCSLTLWLQCKEMQAGSSFLTGLAARPESAMGTDWTVISSFDDGDVDEASGVAMNAQHTIQYDDDLDHTELRTVVGSFTARFWHTGSATTWSAWGARVGPLQWAKNASYYQAST